jgi:hypothetical protein
MPIAGKGTVILVLAAFLIALIPKHTIAGNKASKIGKQYHKSAHHRGDRADKLDCASGEIAKFDGSEWICAPDDNTDTLGELNCAPGAIAKFDGSEWICASDDNSDTLGELSCSDGQVAKYDETSKEWACADVGDGPQLCPAGFVALNDKVCIEEYDKGTPFTWFEANRSCIISNARLCTPGEWVFACQENKISSDEPTLEWTDDMADPGGYITILRFGKCTTLQSTSVNFTGANFRCCLDR